MPGKFTGMESWLKSVEKIDVLIAQNDDMGLGAIDAIKAAGLVPGKDVIIVGCDSVKAAFDSIVAGEMNCTVECNPLYSAFVVPTIEGLENGETFGREVIHPAEGVFDCVGGIDLGTVSRFLPVLQALSSDQSHSMQLLNALRPYLKEEKQGKVERATRLARLITVGKRFLTEWEG